jgi:hypothetical protein
MTVQCKWSERLAWADEMPLENLLRGGFEPALATKRHNNAVTYACAEMRTEFSSLASSVRSHISSARAVMERYTTKLATRRKGMMGIGAEKIDPTNFSSWSELEQRFAVMTTMRRKWRASHAVELEGFKSLELAFGAYVEQLSATEKATAKSIAEGNPLAYKLSRSDDLEKSAWGCLSAR